jgi:hypothetical protein
VLKCPDSTENGSVIALRSVGGRCAGIAVQEKLGDQSIGGRRVRRIQGRHLVRAQRSIPYSHPRETALEKAIEVSGPQVQGRCPGSRIDLQLNILVRRRLVVNRALPGRRPSIRVTPPIFAVPVDVGARGIGDAYDENPASLV